MAIGEIYNKNGMNFKYLGQGCSRVVRTEEEKKKVYTLTPNFLNSLVEGMITAVPERSTLEKRASESQI